VLDYYLRVGAVLLPHVRDRLLSPCPDRRPDWMDICAANDLPALVWLANSGALELHPSLARHSDVQRPTALVFDLDPGEGADLDDCREVALLLRGMFGQLKLEAFPNTTGSKGIQVYVPLGGDVTYEETKPFAKAVAETLGRSFPDRVVARGAKAARKGRVLVDWRQNAARKSTVAPYSLRATERPTVSMPLTWDEVENAPTANLVFGPEAALERIEACGDIFAPVLTLRQELPRF
jgi:bifunctional non-homologous end joining protein LigD